MTVTGSLKTLLGINAYGGFTGSFLGTSSYAESASYAPSSPSSSYSLSSSFAATANNATSASYALNATNIATGSSFFITSSWSTSSISASYSTAANSSLSSSYALNSNSTLTASGYLPLAGGILTAVGASANILTIQQAGDPYTGSALRFLSTEGYYCNMRFEQVGGFHPLIMDFGTNDGYSCGIQMQRDGVDKLWMWPSSTGGRMRSQGDSFMFDHYNGSYTAEWLKYDGYVHLGGQNNGGVKIWNHVDLKQFFTLADYNSYYSYTDASNYQGLKLTTSATAVTLAAQTAGTGADNIDIVLTPAGAGGVLLGGAKLYTNSTDYLQASSGTLTFSTPYGAAFTVSSGQNAQFASLYLLTEEGKYAGLVHYDDGHANGRMLDIFGQPGVSFRFSPGGATAMSITTGGNVGIGTVSPVAQLQITAGSAGTTGSIIKGATSQTADLLQFRNSGDTVLASVSAAGVVDANLLHIQGSVAVSVTGATLRVGYGGFSTFQFGAGANYIVPEADNVISFRNTSSVQTVRVYGTYTDSSNYVRGAISSSATSVYIGAESAGTGASNLDVHIASKGTGYLVVSGSSIPNNDYGGGQILQKWSQASSSLSLRHSRYDAAGSDFYSFYDDSGSMFQFGKEYGVNMIRLGNASRLTQIILGGCGYDLRAATTGDLYFLGNGTPTTAILSILPDQGSTTNYFFDKTSFRVTGAYGAGTFVTMGVASGVSFSAPTSSLIPLTVSGFASQTANLTNWKNSSGTILASVSASGAMSSSLFIATTFQGTASVALSSSNASFATSASYALSSSRAISSSFAANAPVLATGSRFFITSSWATSSINSVSSSYSLSASYAPGSPSESSSYAESSSWSEFAGTLLGAVESSSYSLSSSWSEFAGTLLGTVESASYSLSSSWADSAGFVESSSYSLSSSWSEFAGTLLGTVESSSYAESASWSEFAGTLLGAVESSSYSLSSSWADVAGFVESSSYSLSSSWADSAGFAESSSYSIASGISDVASILSIPEANERMGIATLTAGTVTVSNTIVTATSRIFLTAQSLGTITVPAAYAISARTATTDFTILSSDASDTSEVAWMIVEPA